jgi:hypothetical protein
MVRLSYVFSEWLLMLSFYYGYKETNNVIKTAVSISYCVVAEDVSDLWPF